MWEEQGIFAKIRHLPDLLSKYGFERRDPRGNQVKLVSRDEIVFNRVRSRAK